MLCNCYKCNENDTENQFEYNFLWECRQEGGEYLLILINIPKTNNTKEFCLK